MIEPLVVARFFAETFVEHVLTRVAKWRMADVVRQGERFHEVFIEPQARASVRAIEETSSVWVSRVRW